MFSKWSVASGVAILLFALLADTSSAQEKQRRGGGGFFGGRGVVSIANNEAVQKEIGVADDVKSKLTALNEKYRTESQEQLQGAFAGRDATQEEQEKAAKKLVEVTRSLNAKYVPQLKEILKPDQFTRVQEISRQAAGQALTEEDVAKELNLSKEQQDKIAGVIGDYRTKTRGLFGDGNFQEAAAKMRELGQQRDKMAEEVLNKEQQEKFAKLKGKSFDVSQLGFGGGGRRKQNNN